MMKNEPGDHFVAEYKSVKTIKQYLDAGLLDAVSIVTCRIREIKEKPIRIVSQKMSNGFWKAFYSLQEERQTPTEIILYGTEIFDADLLHKSGFYPQWFINLFFYLNITI